MYTGWWRSATLARVLGERIRRGVRGTVHRAGRDCWPLRAAVTLALMLLCGPAVAQTVNPMSGPVDTTVTGAGTYGDQSIYVFFADAISGCSDTLRIDLAANHPARDNVYTIAVTAFATGAPVRIRPALCNGGVPLFDSSKNSYFYLNRR